MNTGYFLFWTLLIFPIYMLIRWPYFKLPIGPDAGYYISNDTILNKKINFAKGWNANYAACSKLIPEYFYSLVYLWFGRENYKFSSRFFYSIYNYLTAITVGLISYLISNNNPLAYILGLVSYCLISSEPHYGVYFESAEKFENFFQTLGILFIVYGLVSNNLYIVLAGIGLWFVDSIFVKISALASTFVIAIGIGLLNLSTLPWIVMMSFLSLSIYIVLMHKMGLNPFELFKRLLGHQSYYNRIKKDRKSPLIDFCLHCLKKTKQSLKILIFNPIIPVLTLLGVITSFKNIEYGYKIILIFYIIALLIKFYISFYELWYYNISFLPVMAIFAAVGSIAIMQKFTYGFLFIGGFLVIWVILNVFRVYLKDKKSLNTYAWKIQAKGVGELDYLLDKISQQVREIVKGSSMLVYGFTHLYIMVGTSYGVDFSTAVSYMDGIDKDWMNKLHSKMLKSPPGYIFDMFKGCKIEAIKENLGLEYKLFKVWNNRFYLFELVKQNQIEGSNFEFRSLKS